MARVVKVRVRVLVHIVAGGYNDHHVFEGLSWDGDFIGRFQGCVRAMLEGV